MANGDHRDISCVYDRIAGEYLARFGLPAPGTADREFIDQSLALMGPGPVLDAGCGPGQLAGLAARSGRRSIGADLSPGMLAVAAEHCPDSRFLAADLRRLPLRAGTCTGVFSSYVFHHIPRDQAGPALAGLRRVLAPGGRLAVATHLGQGERQVTGDWGERQRQPLTITLYGLDEFTALAEQAGFGAEVVIWRPPADGEFPAEHGFFRLHAR